ncbi:MAG: (deoxy)nucleoside triphosphate pyrophosphohydrolase [Gemmatimonadota bacterium]
MSSPDSSQQRSSLQGSPPPIPVLAAVIRRNHRYLLCLRPPGKRHGGLWEFPGGKLDAGESEREGVTRELREELDVEVTAVGEVMFSRRDPGSAFVIHFLQVEIRGEPRALEHSQVGWFTVEEASRMRLAPSDAAFLKELAPDR